MAPDDLAPPAPGRDRPAAEPPAVEPASRELDWYALDPAFGEELAAPFARRATIVGALIIAAALIWASRVALPVVVVAGGVVRHAAAVPVPAGAAGRVSTVAAVPGLFVERGQLLTEIEVGAGEPGPGLDGRAALRPVVAPEPGIVQRIRAEGSVVAAASEVATIVPFAAPLVVEATLAPGALAAVRIGQPVRIRPLGGGRAALPADGRVERIWRAVLGDDDTPAGYRVRIAFAGTKPAAPAAGTQVQADIVVGTRSLLAYLALPARLIGGRAFREP